ncbi:MAG: thioredoxin-disulfide reductase [Clostridiaceae bacterium]|nr:thioredoxin-disulfide reductase [Clostridiaceae bacterium]
MERLVIIGGGPAGLTAAIYAARAGLKPLVLEMLFAGGQMTNTMEIENYPGYRSIEGSSLAEAMRTHAESIGVRFQTAEMTALEKTGDNFRIVTSDGNIDANCVIMATGASRRKLAIPGEAEYAGRGVSYCATCDGGFFRGKTAAVVGGGDTALEDALYLADILREVTLIHRRNAFRADEILIQRVRAAKNIRILTPYKPAEITGETKADGIRLIHAESGVEMKVDCDAVFIAVGSIPNTKLLSDLVDLAPSGYVLAGEDCCTKTPGLFVAGDLRQKPLYQIVTATADGAVAAKKAADYLRT